MKKSRLTLYVLLFAVLAAGTIFTTQINEAQASQIDWLTGELIYDPYAPVPQDFRTWCEDLIQAGLVEDYEECVRLHYFGGTRELGDGVVVFPPHLPPGHPGHRGAGNDLTGGEGEGGF